MINWFKKLYSEGRWGFWSLMFLFPIPMVIGILDVAFYWDLNFHYGWFFALFIVFAVMQERELSQKERNRKKVFEEAERKRKRKKN